MDKKTQEIVDFADNGIIDNGKLKMPVLYSMDKHGKFRYWQVIIGVAKNQPGAERSDTNGEWLKKVKFHPVTQELIERGDMPEGTRGVFWSRSGQEGGVEKTTKPTYVVKGTNANKKNYTTAFTQSIRKAMTLFNKKIKDGNVPDKTVLRPRDAVYTFQELLNSKHRGDTPWRVFVMALHDVNDTKTDNWSRVKYPAYIQPKYDGTRFIIVSHPGLPARNISGLDSKNNTFRIDSYSRGREHYANDHVLAELAPTLAKYPGLHLDGELWKKGYGLQDISGSSRREKDTKNKNSKRADAINLDFNVFDAFYVDRPDMPFEERNAVLDDFFDDLENDRKTSYVVRVPTTEVDNKSELMETYEEFLESGFEGGVIRNADSPYEVGINKEERSRQSFKIKPRFDSEWPIVGFQQGKRGKEKGAVIWECADRRGDKPLSERKTFTVTPNWTYDKRYDVYKYFTENPKVFDDKFKGAEAVIEYATLSKDDFPQQPKFIRFRDTKLDELLNKSI